MDIRDAITGNAINVKARPNAGKTALLKIEGGFAHIALDAPAEDGKANAELERFLTKQTGRKARVVSGTTSRRKLVRLA